MVPARVALAAVAVLACAACHRDAVGPPGPTPPPTGSSPPASPDAGEAVVRLEDDGKTLDVARGTTVTVELQLSSGTGFSWTPAPADGGVLVQQGERASEQTDAAARPGAPRLDVFRFAALSPGTAVVTMELRRPWETDSPPAKTFRVTVRVR